MGDRKPLVAGVSKGIVAGNEKQGVTLADIQAAVDAAGKSYRERFGLPPTHVALPPGLDPKGVQLYTLGLGCETGPGMVIVGRLAEDDPEPGRDGASGG